MKIVHVITRLILGGAQENTLLTCEGLHARGHEVTLITGPALGPEGQLLDRAGRGGYGLIVIGSLRRAIHPLRDLSAYGRLKKHLARLDPDIVHTHSAKAGILGRRAAYLLRQRRAASCCGRVSRVQAARLATCGRPRIVHTIHGLAFHPYQSGLLNRGYIAAERWAARRTDVLICVAQAMTDQSLAAGVGQPGQYTRVLSGLETEMFLRGPAPERLSQIRRELDIPAEAVVLVKVARLFDLKGHEYVIEAARRVVSEQRNVVWLFVGDGSRRAALERQIAAAGLRDHFRLVGLVPPERVAELLHASDILVHCSLREGLARALPQALLCGRPVISFDVDGAREVVLDNQTGFLVPPRDIDALAAAQLRLIGDPDLRRRLGQAGRELCRDQFDHRRMVDRIERIYQDQMALCPVEDGE
ncbi:MAG: glycosyltransferase family 4 protein [Sedimentisphaerales bacterium]|nr:glycosyltransferase family 4 protein [Sedimentisphaerales bacterium]